MARRQYWAKYWPAEFDLALYRLFVIFKLRINISTSDSAVFFRWCSLVELISVTGKQSSGEGIEYKSDGSVAVASTVNLVALFRFTSGSISVLSATLNILKW
jgi:hypothetical protein